MSNDKTSTLAPYKDRLCYEILMDAYELSKMVKQGERDIPIGFINDAAKMLRYIQDKVNG